MQRQHRPTARTERIATLCEAAKPTVTQLHITTTKPISRTTLISRRNRLVPIESLHPAGSRSHELCKNNHQQLSAHVVNKRKQKYNYRDNQPAPTRGHHRTVMLYLAVS